MDVMKLFQVVLQSIRSIIGLLPERDDFVHDFYGGLLRMRTGSAGTFFQGFNIEVGLLETIKPEVKVRPLVAQL
jgi:hypothetical protein